MKVALIALGVETQIQDYKVSKKLDDFGVVIELDTKAVFDKSNGYALLLENTLQGNTKEPALITIPCANDDIEINGFIGHNEGKVNFKSCRMEKKVNFENPIECIIDKEINIFDYTPSNTKTVQGEIRRQHYGNNIFGFYPSWEDENTFPSTAEIISLLGGVPDRTSTGYYTEYITVSAIPQYELVDNGQGGQEQQYSGHELDMYVAYVGIFSATQPDANLWSPLGAEFYYNAIPTIEYLTPFYNQVQFGNSYYLQFFIEAGKLNLYKDVPISNTFLVKEIIEDIFTCTGLEVVSNFLDINSDASNPDNNEYEFATNNLHNLKIAQSFDIIRESAIEDSFGKSGTFSAKQMILEFNKLFGMVLIYDSIVDVMRWEHYTYFENKGIDFETQGIEYEFSDDADINKDIVNTETWTMAQPSPTDGFYQTKIDYQNYSLNSEINDIAKKSDKFMTDVFGTLNNKEYEGDGYKKLFYLLSTDGQNMIGLNSALSIRSIVQNLHYRNRALKTAKHDGKDVVFSGFSVGLSAEISFFGNFKVFNKINPSNTVKLNVNGFGTWLIDEIEIEDKKITLKIKK